MYHGIKRAIDFTGALLMIVLLSPVFALMALYIRIESKGPAFFKQMRSGRYRQPFLVYKFRTMRVEAPVDSPTNSLKNPETYITHSGKILRRLGVDELPQLINIIKGEMSFIGPRPVVLSEEDLLVLREQYGANACIPGIGGWAQANGRDEVEVEEKAYMDGIYAQNFGLKMDIKCLFKTLEVLITGYGHRENYTGEKPVKKISLRAAYFKNFTNRVVSKIEHVIPGCAKKKSNTETTAK